MLPLAPGIDIERVRRQNIGLKYKANVWKCIIMHFFFFIKLYFNLFFTMKMQSLLAKMAALKKIHVHRQNKTSFSH